MMDQVEEVKSRVDIVEIISSYLTLKKAGAHYKACCPFHNEKTPSMMISPERQNFKCFGCSEGGDVITFVEKMEGLDFYNALKLLAERAGVELKNDKVKFGEKEYKADKKTRLFEINEWAKKVYHYILLNDKNADKARNYLQKRGLTDETIKNFEIGYAPDSWDFTIKYLNKKGYKEEEILEAGIATKSERGKIFDRFRGRIMFPINNIMGNTIAFTSRILQDDGKSAKYINSAESSIYIKGKTIYGLEKAKLAIKEANLAILVEGQMDVIACHQAGFKNVVATSGTALTLDQLKILSRYAKETAFSFDADVAGQTAMKRAIRMALQNDVTTKIITLPSDFKDPDEAIKSDPNNWVKAVKLARPSLEYWIDKLISSKENLSIDDKKSIAKEILPVVKVIYSEIEKEHYIKYLAQKLGISEQSLVDALNKSKGDKEFANKKEDSGENSQIEEKNSLEERIFGLIWAEPTLLSLAETELEKITTNGSKNYEPLVEMIRTKSFDRDKIKPEIAGIYDQLTLGVIKNLDSNNENALRDEFLYLVGRYKSDQKEDLKEKFARRIKEAEQKGDTEKLRELLKEFSSLIK